jgi:hypothetical protein
MATTRERICFVVSPIGDEGSEIRQRSDMMLESIIRPAAKVCGYEAMRADESASPGLITADVVRHLIDDPLVIADLTDLNPNVMYELAVRHATGRPFLQIIRKGQSIPFDIVPIRTFRFDEPNVQNLDATRAELVKWIKEAEKGALIETPILNAIDLQRLQTSPRPEERSLADLVLAISDIRSEVKGATDRMLKAIRSDHEVTDSVYAWRAGHYRREKKHIAEQFIRRTLGKRVEYLQQQFGHRRIRIIFDSGSTIAPMLDVLGQEAEGNPEHWCKEIQAVTNNIKGIENILRYRDQPGNRYGNLPLADFSVLPGKVLAAFEAIADPRTLEALESYREDRYYTIAVTTGNYILLHDREFLPIARAGFHPHFKATLYDIASEVYVIAPLGKILMWVGKDELGKAAPLEDMLDRLNTDLKLKSMSLDKDSEEKRYHLVNEGLVWSRQGKNAGPQVLTPWLEKSVLVTTRRTDACLFERHFLKVEAELGHRNFSDDWGVGSGPRLLATPFLALPLIKDEQFKVEVPHENLRRFARKYFFMRDDWPGYQEAAAAETDTSEFPLDR